MIIKRPHLVALAVGVLVALLVVGGTMALLAVSPTNYRAEAQVALLPARNTPPAELSSSWEALSRGQSSRIAAEVLGQRRWLSAAARSAGAPPSSLQLTAGAVADTTIILVDVVAPTPQGAEKAVDAVVDEARPLIENVAGQISVEMIQPPDGSATPTGTPAPQLLSVVGIAGLLIGAGVTLLVHRRVLARRNRLDSGFTTTQVSRFSVSPGEHEDDVNHADGTNGPSNMVATANGTAVKVVLDELASESGSDEPSVIRRGDPRWRPSPVKRLSETPANHEEHDQWMSGLVGAPAEAVVVVDDEAEAVVVDDEAGAEVAPQEAFNDQTDFDQSLADHTRRPTAETANGSRLWPLPEPVRR